MNNKNNIMKENLMEKEIKVNDFRNEEKPELKVIEGGKGGGTRDGVPWLLTIPVGTSFLCRPVMPANAIVNPNISFLAEYILFNKTADNKAALLMSQLNREEYAWVSVNDFSRLFQLFHRQGNQEE